MDLAVHDQVAGDVASLPLKRLRSIGTTARRLGRGLEPRITLALERRLRGYLPVRARCVVCGSARLVPADTCVVARRAAATCIQARPWNLAASALLPT